MHGADGPVLNVGDGDKPQEDPDDPVTQVHGHDEPAGDAVDKPRGSTGPASDAEKPAREAGQTRKRKCSPNAREWLSGRRG